MKGTRRDCSIRGPDFHQDVFLTAGWPTLRGSRAIDPEQVWEVDSPAMALTALRQDGIGRENDHPSSLGKLSRTTH